jgi:hypothetical protein
MDKEVKRLIPKERRCGNCKFFEIDQCQLDKIVDDIDETAEYVDADDETPVFDDITIDEVDETLGDVDAFDMCVITALIGCELFEKKE